MGTANDTENPVDAAVAQLVGASTSTARRQRENGAGLRVVRLKRMVLLLTILKPCVTHQMKGRPESA